MIVNALISFIIPLITILISSLPAIDPSVATGITTNVNNFMALFVGANYIFPVDWMLILGGYRLGLELALFLWHMGKWVVQIFSGGVVKTS